MQALLIFLPFFSCAALLYLHLSFTSLFLLKVLQNQNAIQSNQQISYHPDIDSLLNWWNSTGPRIKSTTRNFKLVRGSPVNRAVSARLAAR
jgi:hypothetical protein